VKHTAACTLFIVSLSFAACTADLSVRVFTADRDPEVSTPVVSSFLVERSLRVTWQYDTQCDEYILYRDTSVEGPFETIVYRGSDTHFDDTKLETDTFYYYRLAKRLGNTEFPKSDYAAGVSTFSRQDEYEYDNTMATAGKLDNTTNGNIYYFNDSFGNVFEDTDWYYIGLEPVGTEKSSVRLIINEYSPNIEAGDIRYSVEGRNAVPLPLHQGEPFDIVNDKDEACDVFFQISVNKDKTTNPFLNKMGSYKLSIVYFE
jgi:hypothetical protein